MDWFPRTYQLDFDVNLRSTYPDNREPDTKFSGFARIRVQCRHSTDELRIHVKQLHLAYATLIRLGTKINLISDWTAIGASEILLCRLRERCIQGEEYEFRSEYTAELDREMAGFYLSRYNVTDPVTGEIVTHNIGATHMQVRLNLKIKIEEKILFNFSQQLLVEYFHVLMNHYSKQILQ